MEFTDKILKKLTDNINNTYNRIGFDTIDNLRKTLHINKKQLKTLKQYKMIKIVDNYIYVNPSYYKGNSFIAKSVYELFNLKAE